MWANLCCISLKKKKMPPSFQIWVQGYPRKNDNKQTNINKTKRKKEQARNGCEERSVSHRGRGADKGWLSPCKNHPGEQSGIGWRLLSKSIFLGDSFTKPFPGTFKTTPTNCFTLLQPSRGKQHDWGSLWYTVSGWVSETVPKSKSDQRDSQETEEQTQSRGPEMTHVAATFFLPYPGAADPA